MTFIQNLVQKHGISSKHVLVKYLERKTQAVDRGSKARRSLGNLYALLVLAEDFTTDTTSRFTNLLARMKDLPFGSKLQNHPLDNRLNDEFSRQMKVDGALLPVQDATVNGQKARKISERLLQQENSDPKVVARFVVDVIKTYIQLITEKQTDVLTEIDEISTIDELNEFITEAFAPHSDARLFEIVSYVILAEHFQNKTVFFGPTADTVKAQPLKLFRTGRTNANDGGIDFVLQPYGKFFQVTETLDFSKYFLDFEKVNRFPISFVVKVEGTKESVKSRIQHDAENSQRYTRHTIEMYMDLFDEVYTLTDLQNLRNQMEASSVDRIKSELILQFQLEYGLLD
jgi:hypothetical protein